MAPESGPFTFGALCGANPAPVLGYLCRAAPSGGLVHAVIAVQADHHRRLLAALPQQLACPGAAAWPTELPEGFHRLHLDRWVLTVCVGPVAQSVSQWRMRAHGLVVDASHAQQAPQLARLLARQCLLKARLQLLQPHADAHEALLAWQQAGFVTASADTPDAPTFIYQPRWPVATPAEPGPRQALVIGAGLAGAAACQALTSRGWQVTLLEQSDGPAHGASGLPVGLLSAHVTASETVLSRLSRPGMAMHLRELQRLVPEGAGWQATQVLNLRQGDDTEGLEPDEPSAPAEASSMPWLQCGTEPIPAAMVRPSALVHGWLTEAQATGLLTTRWNSPVARLQRVSNPAAGRPVSLETTHANHSGTATGEWQALDALGAVLAQAPHVVVAAAFGSADLLHPLGEALEPGVTLRPVKGQLSHATLSGEPMAPHPLRDHGVYVPCYSDSGMVPGCQVSHRMWAMGSTYERGQNNAQVTAQAHAKNIASLAAMLPQAQAVMEQAMADGTLQGWAQVRCASTDRLPLVGAVPARAAAKGNMKLPDVPRVPGLWALCALGSRGLTLSLLAAELLVALLEGEPIPMEKELCDALDPARFALKRARKLPAASQPAVPIS
jgi:tRNA 5-methylaminomethyl-2-thiouridine biosynthesis bifunctional protein